MRGGIERFRRVRRAKAMLVFCRARLHYAWRRLGFSELGVVYARAEDCVAILRAEGARIPKQHGE